MLHTIIEYKRYPDAYEWIYILYDQNLPKNVEQIYSDIWLPDLLDSLKCESSLFSIRLNYLRKKKRKKKQQQKRWKK